jgi:hypothetical protein
MAITQGYRSQTFVGIDNAINDPISSSGGTFQIPFMSNTLTYTQSLNESAVLRGVRATSKPFFGNKSAEGGLDVPFDADLTGLFFKALCGNAEAMTTAEFITDELLVWTNASEYRVGDMVKDAVIADTFYVCIKAGTSGGTIPTFTSVVGDTFEDGTVVWQASQDFVHMFKVDTTALPYLYVEKAMPDIDEYVVYRGLKVNTLSLAVGGDGEMMASMNMIGVRADDPAQESISENIADIVDLTTNRFQFQNFKAEVSSSILSADELNSIRNINVEFNNNLQGDIYTINSRGARREIPEGLMAISGTLDVLFESTSMMLKATNGTEIDLTLTFVEEGHVCKIFLPEVRIEPFDPTVDGPEGLTATINFRAYLDNNQAAPVHITLTNSVEDYDI